MEKKPADELANLLVELFIQLNSARQVGEFCSCDHPQCLRAIERSVEIISQATLSAGEVVFRCNDGMINAGDTRITPDEPLVNDYASVLHGAGITVVRLAGDTTADGLTRFTRLLTARVDQGMDAAKIRQFLSGPVARGIRVGLAPSVPPSEPMTGGNPPVSEALWTADVRRRLGATGEMEKQVTSGESVSVSLADIDPLQLAELINSLEFSGDIDVISGHFLVPYLEQAMKSSGDDATLVPPYATSRFLHLLRELSPGHQLQFITAALETSHRFTLFTGAVLEAVPIHLLGQAFSGIRTEENTVHPRIASRYETLCRLTGWAPGNTDGMATDDDGPDLEGGNGSILESPATDDDAQDAAAKHGPITIGRKLSTAMATDFSAAGKRKAIIRVCLDLFERSTSAEEAKVHSATLPPLFTEALNERDWTGLNRDWHDLVALVARGRKTKPYLGQALEDIRKKFHTIQAFEIISGSITHGTDETREVLGRLLPVLGRRAGESLVLALIEANDRQQRKNLLTAIVSFGEDAIPLALKRINDHRWYVVRNMIAIIREVGDKRAGEDLLPLSTHAQFQVRKELVNTLLQLDHSEGIELAEKGVRGNDQKMRSACIGLLGSHRVKDAIEILLRILEDKYQGGVPFSQAQKKSAVWALGQIGDRRALPTLHGLLKRKSLFKTPDSQELKMAILSSLPGYPLEDAMPLARWGASHGDEDEAQDCQKMLDEFRAGPGGAG